MAYATYQDLLDRMGVADVTLYSDLASPPAGAPNTVLVGKILDDAAAVINSYIGSKYTLPVSPVPQVLLALNVDIARYRLMGRSATEEAKATYRAAIAILQDLATGKATLDAAGVASTVESARIAVVGSDRVFTADTLSDYL